MLQINCPWCGYRDEDEFTCGGQSHIIRPADPAAADNRQWAAYLYDRINPKGINLERWRHSFGCRQWFNVARDTVSHEILAVYGMTDSVPADVRQKVSAQTKAPVYTEVPAHTEATAHTKAPAYTKGTGP